MLSDVINQVYFFNRSVVGIPQNKGSIHLSVQEQNWLVKVLREEATELEESPKTVDQVDALCDSIIFAIGGFCRLGLSEDQAVKCLTAVMEANLEKKAGQKKGREVEGVKDAIKPEGWKGPEERIEAILYGK
jgi:predicted HAD superfamily Cof-like phosphohydrolase